MSPAILELLSELRKRVTIGFVGGSDLAKISEQLAIDGKPGSPRPFSSIVLSLIPPLHFAVVEKFDYAFAENGLTAFKLGKQLPSQSFIKHIGEDKYKPLVNFILHYIGDLDIPIKRCDGSAGSLGLRCSFAVLGEPLSSSATE